MKIMDSNLKKRIMVGGIPLLAATIITGAVAMPKASAAELTPSVQYRAHVEDHGWMDLVSDGKMAGTEGEARRMEAIEMHLVNVEGASLSFDVHVENIGWLENLTENDVIGTQGRALRMEAIRIRANGLEEYKLQYRVHVENIGWTNWVEEGEMAGTEGKALRVEAIEVKLVSEEASELVAAKQDALAQLRAYKAEDYTINAEEFAKALADGEKAINDCDSILEIFTELTKAKTNIGLIHTDKQELADLDTKKEVAAVDFAVYVSEQLEEVENVTDEAHKSAIAQAITSMRKPGENLIYAVTAEKDITKAADTAKENVVKSTRTAVQNILDSLYNDGKEDSYLTTAAYETAVNAIKSKDATVSSIISAYTTAVAAKNMTDLDTIKETTTNTLSTDFATLATGEYAKVDAIQKAIENGEDAIDAAETRVAIDQADKTARTNILNATKEYVKVQLVKLYNNGKAVNGKVFKLKDFNIANRAIDKATEVSDMLSAYNTAKAAVIDLDSDANGNLITNAISDLTGYVDAEHKKVVSVKDIENASEKAIKEATTAREIEDIVLAAQNNMLERVRTYYLNEIANLTSIVQKNDKNYNFTTAIRNEAKATVSEAETIAEMKKAYDDAFTAAEVTE